MKELHLTLPNSWAGISPRHLVKIARLQISGITRQHFLVRVLFLVSGLIPLRRKAWQDRNENRRYRWYKLHGQKHLLSDGQIHSSAKRLDFLIDVVTECNPPRILIRYPEKRLYHTRFETYLNMENYFAAYDATKKIKYLNRLCAASLIRRYRPWKENVLATLISLQSKSHRYAIFIWYSGFRWYCQERFPHLFRTDPDAEPADFAEHLAGMIRCLNKGDITRNDQLMKSLLWDALHELEASCKLSDELKKKK